MKLAFALVVAGALAPLVTAQSSSTAAAGSASSAVASGSGSAAAQPTGAPNAQLIFPSLNPFTACQTARLVWALQGVDAGQYSVTFQVYNSAGASSSPSPTSSPGSTTSRPASSATLTAATTRQTSLPPINNSSTTSSSLFIPFRARADHPRGPGSQLGVNHAARADVPINKNIGSSQGNVPYSFRVDFPGGQYTLVGTVPDLRLSQTTNITVVESGNTACLAIYGAALSSSSSVSAGGQPSGALASGGAGSGERSISTGSIVGIVIGILAALILLGLLAFCLIRRRRRNAQSERTIGRPEMMEKYPYAEDANPYYAHQGYHGENDTDELEHEPHATRENRLASNAGTFSDHHSVHTFGAHSSQGQLLTGQAALPFFPSGAGLAGFGAGAAVGEGMGMAPGGTGEKQGAMPNEKSEGPHGYESDMNGAVGMGAYGQPGNVGMATTTEGKGELDYTRRESNGTTTDSQHDPFATPTRSPPDAPAFVLPQQHQHPHRQSHDMSSNASTRPESSLDPHPNAQLQSSSGGVPPTYRRASSPVTGFRPPLLDTDTDDTDSPGAGPRARGHGHVRGTQSQRASYQSPPSSSADDYYDSSASSPSAAAIGLAISASAAATASGAAKAGRKASLKRKPVPSLGPELRKQLDMRDSPAKADGSGKGRRKSKPAMAAGSAGDAAMNKDGRFVLMPDPAPPVPPSKSDVRPAGPGTPDEMRSEGAKKKARQNMGRI